MLVLNIVTKPEPLSFCILVRMTVMYFTHIVVGKMRYVFKQDRVMITMVMWRQRKRQVLTLGRLSGLWPPWCNDTGK